MYLGFNELSLHGQCTEVDGTLREILGFRQAAAEFDQVLRCTRTLLTRPFSGTTRLLDVLARLPNQSDLKRTFLNWTNKFGPFLDDDRAHPEDLYFEWQGALITDSMLAEVAHRQLQGVTDGAGRHSTASLSRSEMVADPLMVTACLSDTERVDVEVPNCTRVDQLRRLLEEAEPPMRSWAELASRSTRRCSSIRFAPSAFAPLADQPFHPGVATSLLERLLVVEKIKSCVQADGSLSEAGQEEMTRFTHGEKAWFTDSSDTEKVEFKSELTFAHPEQPGQKLFCPWHGKVKTPQMRIHLTWPIGLETTWVVHVGPKLTKR